jgi:hypothetical protein
MHGCGTIAVPTSSTAINSANITLCANAQVFPPGQLVVPLKVKVQALSPSAVYLCKQGGTCSTTGELVDRRERDDEPERAEHRHAAANDHRRDRHRHRLFGVVE